MNILALDVATKTGFATRNTSGTWNLTPKRDSSGGMRLIEFEKRVKDICATDGINLVVFERSAGFHKSALIVQAELHGVLKAFCERNNIEYRAYSAGEIKKFATGKGNAKKPQMIAAAEEKYKVTVIDDNHADALHLYHLAKKDYAE